MLLVLLALLAAAGTWGVNGPLRRYLERRVNAQLVGYTVTIGSLALHPWNLGIDLRQVTVVQDALPRPPVLYLPSWTTHLEWRALLSAALVAKVEMNRPELYINKTQVQQEARDRVKIEDRGWQDALTAVYPLEINAFDVNGGRVRYFDTGPLKSIDLREVEFHARNIRNVRSVAGRFPSPVSARAALEPSGRIAIDGRADFLAKPSPALRVDYRVAEVSLPYLAPLLKPYHVNVDRGALASRGKTEWTARRQMIDVADVTVSNLRLEYVREAATATEDDERLRKATRATTTAKDAPVMRVDVDRAQLRGADLSFVDRASDPPYRLMLDDTGLTVRGFSNQRDAREGTAHLESRFMGSGQTKIDATFRSGRTAPDFSMKLEMVDVDLPALNDLLRARGGFDVAAGRFSVFSQIAVRQGRIDGYVKPLFADVDVYNSAQDHDKGLFQKMYEGIVGGVAQVLENRARAEVATKTDLSGPVDDPKSSTLDIVLNLLKNAFIKSIMPGLERFREEER